MEKTPRKHGGPQPKKEGPFKVNILIEEACRRVTEKHGPWKGFAWPQLKKGD